MNQYGYLEAMAEADCEYLSRNRDMPDVPETLDEKLIIWLKMLATESAKDYDNGNGPKWGNRFERELAAVRMDAGNKEGGGGAKYARSLGCDEVVKMMLTLMEWGPHFRHCDGLKVSQVEKIVRVHGGVSECVFYMRINSRIFAAIGKLDGAIVRWRHVCFVTS
jgi:hypothetical protein